MRRLIVLICVVVVSLAGAPAHASAPPNDAIVDAEVISALPGLAIRASLYEATLEESEPRTCLAPLEGEGSTPRSVWYRFTPEAPATIAIFATRWDPLVVSAVNGLGRASVGVFKTGPLGLDLVACGSSEGGRSRTTFEADATHPYLIQIACACEFRPLTTPYVEFDIALVPPNDNMALATAVDSLPFYDYPFIQFATTEVDEPLECIDRSENLYFQSQYQTTWYRYTADRDDVLRVSSVRNHGGTDLGIFEETLGGLSLVACVDQKPGNPRDTDEALTTLPVVAGHTYAFQLADGDYPQYWTEFSLRRVPRADHAAVALRVGGSATSATRSIELDYTSTDWNSWFTYEIDACPEATPGVCSSIAQSSGGYSTHGYSNTLRASWNAAGCVGRVRIIGRLIPFLDVDPDPLNDEVATETVVVLDQVGTGAGYCGYLRRVVFPSVP